MRTWTKNAALAPAWRYQQPTGKPFTLTGPWTVEFVEGGPALPAPFQIDALRSWTEQGEDAARFAGTVRYRMEFNAPAPHGETGS